jgi:O-antigen/teichoic acid export membrane protein
MFAYYTIAATVASAIWMIIIPFNTAVFPKIVELREKMSQDKLISFFHSTSQVLSILLLPIGFLLIFFSKEILFLWLGDDIIAENAYLILSFLVFGTLLNGLVSMPITTANAYGWPMLTTYTNLAQAIVFIPLIIFLVNKFNGLGASIGWVIINSTYILITVPIFFKKYFKNQKKSWYLYDIIFPFIVSFFICLISKLTAPEFNSILAIIFWLIMTATIAIIFTAISMSTTRNYLITKFLNFGNS